MSTDNLDPERFFDEREGLVVPMLAFEAQKGSRIRLGVDDVLYRFVDGVYRNDGSEYLKSRVRVLLGARYKRRHRDEVLAWFHDCAPTLGVEQPEHVLNLSNGLLDWRAESLLPHSPDVLTTIQIPHAWNPAAACPAIDRFFDQVVPGAREFMYEVFGYALYARLPIHKALLLYGRGRNGKGTTLRLLERLVGGQNISNVALQSLSDDRFAAAEVHGKLANVAGDLDARDMQRSDAFKMLTGGDRINAQRKYAHPFSFTSYALQVFSANEAPLSRDQTDGYFSRWLIVPFHNRYEGPDADLGLDDKLQTRAELEGLLVQSVAGLRRLLARGYFEEPALVREAGDTYRLRLDSVASFVADECVIGVGHEVNRADLYRRYTTWAQDNGRRALQSATFFENVRHRYNVSDRRTSRSRMLVGIGFTPLGGSDWADTPDTPDTSSPRLTSTNAKSVSAVSGKTPPCSHGRVGE